MLFFILEQLLGVYQKVSWLLFCIKKPLLT
nr:MAG TPA: hypothetical protein [Caudoviricetes sp.]